MRRWRPRWRRSVSVMDTYDAMTSSRPYRAAQGKEYAIRELKAFAGSQFDPQVVEAFLSVLEANDTVPIGQGKGQAGGAVMTSTGEAIVM